MRSLALLGVLLVGACFDPAFPYQDGALRCDHGSCPPRYECRADSSCWRQGSAIAPPIDAPLAAIDAAVPPPPDAAPPSIDAGITTTPPPDARADECAAGQSRCSPTAARVPQTCSGGQWQDQAPCAYACLVVDGSCAPDCDPQGPATCISGDAYRCDPGGRWALDQMCPANCNAGVCGGLCTNGDKQCAGADNRTPQSCVGGLWVDGTACEFVCDKGACVVTECHPNVDRKCEAGFPYACDATGHWVKGTACTNVCDGDQCGGICRPGTFRCSGADLQRCADDGKSWTLDHTCPFGCAADQCNACSAEPKATTCQGKCGTVTNNCGTPVDCGDSCVADHGSAWSCGPAHTCVCNRDVAADCAGKCGTIVDRCGVSVDCSAAGNGGVACSGASDLCQPDHACCTRDPLGTTCSGDPGDDCNAQVADNCGVATTCGGACDSGFTCGGNTATPQKCSCPPMAIRCVGNVAQTCAFGLSWGNDQTCDVACIEGVGCGTCTPDSHQCADTTHVQTCQADGTWGTATACPASAPACRPSTQTCGGVCVPGTIQCGTDPFTQKPAVMKCDAEGQFSIVIKDCAAPGCFEGACCDTTDADFCSQNRYCDASHQNCGRSVTCGGDCESRYPGSHYSCDLSGTCTCSPGTTSTMECDESFCDSDGTWIEYGGCAPGNCCCSAPFLNDCTSVTVCHQRGGTCS